MKELKYIKLFEAFESVALSKTLGYMESPQDKQLFLDYLKRLCNKLDLPYSKLSDEYFEYLPFNAALKKADIITDEPCDATSGRAFPDYEVPGATCEKGEIKRKWGRQIRTVTCPICNGTGVKPKQGEPKMVKFWFNHEGKYINTTCVDGIVRPRTSSRRGNLISQLRRDYVHIRSPRIYANQDGWLDGLNKMEHGQYVLISIEGNEIYGILAKEDQRYLDTRLLVIQPKMDGSSPNNYNLSVNGKKWNEWSRYTWNISGGEFDWIRPVSVRLSDEESEQEADPYTWNTGINFNYSGFRSTGRDVEDQIKSAHFALILDFAKLKESEYETRTSMKSSREERKEGTLAFMTDDQIKSQNLKRYIDTLASRMEVDKDLTNVKNVVKKLMGYKNTIFNVKNGHIKSALSELIEDYIALMKSEDQYKEQRLKELNDTVKRYFKESLTRNKNYTRNIEEIKKKIPTDTSIPNPEKYLRILELLEEYSIAIYNNIMNSEIETVDDLEITYQKLLGMKNIFTSRRYNTNNLNSFIDYLNRSSIDYPYRYFTDRYNIRHQEDEIIDGLERGIKIIKKM